MTRTCTILSLVFPAAMAAVARADDGARQALAATLSRSSTGEGQAALARLLDQDPTRTLAELPWALPLAFPGGDWESVRAQAIQASLTEAVRAAFLRAHDPRVFLSAATHDELPPVVRGVVQGVVQALGRGEVRTGDQALPDYEGVLGGFTRFEDASDVRALACEGLGLLPASQASAEALLRALKDPEARVARAAGEALARLSGKADAAGWRAWAQTLPGAPAVPSYDVLPWLLGDPGARERTARVQLLVDALAQRPAELLAVLEEELSALEPDATREALLADVVATAFARADEDQVRSFLEDASARHVALARGVARGIADRVAPFARRGQVDAEEPEPPRSVPLAEDLRYALELLASRPEAELQVDVFRALPALVRQLDETWFALLVPCLEDERPAVRQAAWTVLKELTRQDLGPAPAFWRQWWTTGRGPEESR